MILSVKLKSNLMKKKSIGIITGSGPEAGMHLWKMILDNVRRDLGELYFGDLQAPVFIIHSNPKLGLSMDLEKNKNELWEALKVSLELMNGKVDVVCLSCNILHYFQSRIEACSFSFKFVSLVDTTMDFLKYNDIKEVGFISIPQVMELSGISPYHKLTSICKVKLPDNFDRVVDIVTKIKKDGFANKDTTSKFKDVVNQLQVDNIIIACTELSLILTTHVSSIKYIDPMNLLAKNISSLAIYDNKI